MIQKRRTSDSNSPRRDLQVGKFWAQTNTTSTVFQEMFDLFAPPSASVVSVTTSKSIQNQRFRRNGHHIRILLAEIYRLANFEPKRTESTHFFNIVSNLLLRPFTFFNHVSILLLCSYSIFLLKSNENQQFTRNGYHIHNQPLKIYRLQKVWGQTDRISSSFQRFFDLLKFFDSLQRKT